MSYGINPQLHIRSHLYEMVWIGREMVLNTHSGFFYDCCINKVVLLFFLTSAFLLMWQWLTDAYILIYYVLLMASICDFLQKCVCKSGQRKLTPLPQLLMHLPFPSQADICVPWQWHPRNFLFAERLLTDRRYQGLQGWRVCVCVCVAFPWMGKQAAVRKVKSQ